jgi:hypothetical protein
MTPTLIVLALLALGVGIVAFATRRPPSRPYEQRLEEDTAWGDPPTSEEAAADPFAHAPPAQSQSEPTRQTEPQS